MGAIGILTTIPVMSTLVAKATGYMGKQIGSWVGSSVGNLIEGWFAIHDGPAA
ncbi:hypothetical protein [Erwinia sp.]|uniref:hypothetical protein n=1 Tax=Erwinia citreus TaxID=558 RepID=UPI002899EAEF|nr:hypothetical protein [Erwinia sp.]